MDGRGTAEQLRLMRESLLRLTGRDLAQGLDLGHGLEAAVQHAPYALVAHGPAEDPVFVYGNQTALDLFELPWADFTRLPSRLSAEPVEQAAREALLRRVAEQGYIDDYQGIRISSTGRRFLIQRAVVWDVHDDDGARVGQAAMFDSWLRFDGGDTGHREAHHAPGWEDRHDLGWTGGDSPIGDALAATVAAAAGIPHHELGHGHLDPATTDPGWTHAYDVAEPSAGEHPHAQATATLTATLAQPFGGPLPQPALDEPPLGGPVLDAPDATAAALLVEDTITVVDDPVAGAPSRERVRTFLTLGARGTTDSLSVRYDVDAPPELRPLTRDELEVVVGWMTAEGWEPGLHDAEALWSADPEALWGIEVDGVLVGCGATSRRGPAYGTLGLLVVDPGHRHHGIGSLAFPFLVDLALERLEPGASLGLTAPEWAQDFYERFGFQRHGRVARTTGTGQVRRRGPYTGQVRALRQLPFDRVVAYDADSDGGGIERPDLVRTWITPEGGHGLGAYEAGRLIGIAVARPTAHGLRIGPFHADEPEIAEDLLVALEGALVGQRLVLDVPLDNPDAVALAAGHGFAETASAVRMVLGDHPAPSLRTYGEGLVELG